MLKRPLKYLTAASSEQRRAYVPAIEHNFADEAHVVDAPPRCGE